MTGFYKTVGSGRWVFVADGNAYDLQLEPEALTRILWWQYVADNEWPRV